MADQLRVGITLDTGKLTNEAARKVKAAVEDLNKVLEDTGAKISTADLGQKQLEKYNKILENTAKKRAALMEELGQGTPQLLPGLDDMPVQVSQTRKQFDMLGMSIQQVAREMPAFAYSASTGFMAISNNLPMLADAIQQIRRENDALAAAGQKTVPVWKQVAKSFLSWNTAMSVGITLLTVYGSQIADSISNMQLFKKAIDPAAEAQKQLNDATKKGTENAQKELTQLNVLYGAATDDTRSRQERLDAVKRLQDEYPAYFKNLSDESIMAGQAADAYTRLTKSLTDAAIARASMDKMTENATKLLSLNDQKAALEKQLAPAVALRDQLMKTPVIGEGGASALNNAIINAARLENQLKGVNTEIEALNAANDKLAKNVNISSLVDGGGKGSSGKNLNTNLSTIGGLTNKINELREAQSKASTEQAISLEKEIQLYQKRLNLLQLTIAKAMTGNLADNNYKDKLETPGMTGVDAPLMKLNIPVTFEISQNQIQENLQRMRQMFSDSIPEFDFTGSAVDGLQSIAGIMGSLSGVLNDSAGAWASWGATLLQTIAQVIPQIIALANTQIAASVEQTTANTAVAASGAAASVASIPIVGWVMAAGAVASILGVLASLPKPKALASGGIAYGPTLALVGEYAGASSRPEVIAPLDRLQSLIQPAQPDWGKFYVETKIRQGDLYIAVMGENYRRKRTR